MPVPAGKKTKRAYPVSISRQGKLFNCHVGRVYFSAEMTTRLKRLFDAGVGAQTAARNMGMLCGKKLLRLWAEFDQKEWAHMQEAAKKPKAGKPFQKPSQNL